jgi:hypothetical protein
MVVSSKQLLLTVTGELIEAMGSKNKSILWWDGNNYQGINIKKVESSNQQLHKFISAHGRLIVCPFNTDFVGNPVKDYDTVNYSKIKNIESVSLPGQHHKTQVSVLGNLPIFGDLKYSNEELELLKNSFYLFQHKRPNSYTKLNVARSYSKLAHKDLEYIISSFLDSKIIKHLTSSSKDLLIFLLSRLGIRANGHSIASPLAEHGTLRIKGKSNDPIRYENLRYSGKSNNDPIKLIFDKPTPNVLIGSFLCLNSH